MSETKYTEIFRLKEMLEQADIPFEFFDRRLEIPDFKTLERYHIEYPKSYESGERVCSVIEGWSTYGAEENLLEIKGLLTPEEEQYDSVCGFLSAEEVFERIKHHYETEGKTNG